MKKETKNLGLKIFTLVLVLFIAVSSLMNANLLIGALKTSKEKDLGTSETISEIKNAYTSKFKAKDSYINFNGLFGRLSGRTIYNDVALINNGMLMDNGLDKPDTATYSKNIIDFAKFLEESNTKYLYVQAPYKLDTAGELKSKGCDNQANAYADEMISALSKGGVNTLDLRPYISATADLVEKHYYRTDHHWNSEGAFLGYTKIVDEIRKLYPQKNFDPLYTDRSNWNSKTYEDIFLGSMGKRVGKYYAGVDDFVYIHPKFDTSMSCYVAKYKSLYKGDFTKAVFREYFVSKVDYFRLNNYCTYIGGDFPLVQHRNYKSDNDLKVLFIKDSYSLPLQSFLSTSVKELDVLDPRHYKDGTIAEYIKCTKPDLVIMMVNPSIMDYPEYYDYGINKLLPFKDTTTDIVNDKNILVSAADSDYNYFTCPEILKPNTAYTVTFSDVELQKGKADFVSAGLYDTVSKALLKNQAFDLEYCKAEDSFSWTFVTPNTQNELRLLLYAGPHGSTKNKQALWKGYKLQQHN